MHFSPQALQLGAAAQANVDLTAAGSRFQVQYGAPPPPPTSTAKYVVGGALLLGALWLFSRSRRRG